MKDKRHKKVNIISMRLSDEERAEVQKIMDIRNKRASSIMREALNLFKEQWERSLQMETPAGS
jgi:hypothetical protein